MAYRVAIPLQRFKCRKAFSTKCLILYSSLSYSRCILRFFFGGMTTFIPCDSASWMMASVSYALSANKCSALIPSINGLACVQSAVVPSVINILTGIPNASTARCSLVLSPLLCGSFLDFRLLPQLHVDVLLYGSHQS